MDRHRLPEVALGVAWWVGQGHEHLLGPPAVLPDVVLDRRVSAVEPVLVPQPLKDPLRRVALLPGDLAVSFQDGVNYPGEGLKPGSAGWFLAPVPWRYRVGQHLAHRVPVQTEHSRGFPNAHPFHHAGPANPRVHLHCKHPLHLPKTDAQPYGRRWTVRFPAAVIQPADPPTWSTLPPPFTLRAGTCTNWPHYTIKRSLPEARLPSAFISRPTTVLGKRPLRFTSHRPQLTEPHSRGHLRPVH